MTEQPRKQPSAKHKPQPTQQEKKHENERLDEALRETFPASDPLAMLEPAPNSQKSDKGKKK